MNAVNDYDDFYVEKDAVKPATTNDLKKAKMQQLLVLREQLEQLRLKDDTITSLHTQKKELESELATLSDFSGRYVYTQNNIIASLKSAVASAHRQPDGTDEQLLTLRNQVKAMELQVAEQTAACKSVGSENAKLRMRCDAMEKQIVYLTGHIEKSQESWDDLKNNWVFGQQSNQNMTENSTGSCFLLCLPLKEFRLRCLALHVNRQSAFIETHLKLLFDDTAEPDLDETIDTRSACPSKLDLYDNLERAAQSLQRIRDFSADIYAKQYLDWCHTM